MANNTIKDIARIAGVSIATVSRVINGNYPVSSEAREKVSNAIKEFNYRPNAIARSLKMESTHTIGLLVSANAARKGLAFFSFIESIPSLSNLYNSNLPMRRS